MRLNRFACLVLFAAFFACFAIAPPSGIAKEKKSGAAVNKTESRFCKHGKPTPYYGTNCPENGAPVLQGATSGTIGPSDAGGEVVVNPYIDPKGFPHTASPTIAMPAPTLQGATNGTIGPPSSPIDPSFRPELPNVSVDPPAIVPAKKESPVIPSLLFASLALSLIFVGVRSVVFKKRAPLFVLGLIAAGALMLVGFMFQFYEPVTLAVKPMAAAVEPMAVDSGIQMGPETANVKFTPPPNSAIPPNPSPPQNPYDGAATAAASVVEYPD